MDPMDVDQAVVDVPDTPDRLAKQRSNRRIGVEVETHCSKLPCHDQQKLFDEGTRDQPVVIDSGSRGMALRPPKRTSSPSICRNRITSASLSIASSSSSRNAHLFRKGLTEKNPRFLTHDSLHQPHLQSMRPPCDSKSSSSFQNDGILDQPERSLHGPVIRNASPGRAPGNNQADFRKRSGLASVTSLHGPTNFPFALRNASEETNNVSRVSSSMGFGEGVDVVGNDNKRPGNVGFVSLDSIASPRVNKQKRLVRNGCISPNNIAKAKQLAVKDINGSVAVPHGSTASIAPDISTDIRELVAEDTDFHTRKGKGVINYPCSSNEPDLHIKSLNSRSSTSSNEKTMEMIDYSRGENKSTEESGVWRSTHNGTREIYLSSTDKELCLIGERDAPVYSSQHRENRSERREKGISIASGEDYSKNPSFFSSEHVPAQPLRESLSRPRARFGRLHGPRSAADSLIKRQKQGSTSSGRGERSTSVSHDPEVVFLLSSAEADNSRCSSSNTDNLQQIIEVDEISPQLRQNAHDEDARARQVEADELLARELQEQLYNEMPFSGVGEVDEHIALALQHQDGSNHGTSRARRPVLDARLMSSLHRQSQSRSSSNAPRRGSLARASTLGRMTRLRSRFPGQPRTLLPSTGRTSMFPPDMDVDMRMHILGALEEFSNMGMSTGLLQADRDFNENDYEMLLALDDNIQHGGASNHQINGLPQSTVQSDNFEESCAVCLETPTVGETIRHLPCLHKFHKDCIDPWLRRRTSCPVCKSSIT